MINFYLKWMLRIEAVFKSKLGSFSETIIIKPLQITTNILNLLHSPKFTEPEWVQILNALLSSVALILSEISTTFLSGLLSQKMNSFVKAREGILCVPSSNNKLCRLTEYQFSFFFFLTIFILEITYDYYPFYCTFFLQNSFLYEVVSMTFDPTLSKSVFCCSK